MRKHNLIYYRDKKKQWRWKLQSSNGNIVACSAEGYKRIGSARKGWKSTRKGCKQFVEHV